jgi:hypothetical protein
MSQYSSDLALISCNMYGLLKETIHEQMFLCGNRVKGNGADVAAEGTDRVSDSLKKLVFWIWCTEDLGDCVGNQKNSNVASFLCIFLPVT